jgi:5-formyltetrahydrofolate cyclo-ligase
MNVKQILRDQLLKKRKNFDRNSHQVVNEALYHNILKLLYNLNIISFSILNQTNELKKMDNDVIKNSKCESWSIAIYRPLRGEPDLSKIADLNVPIYLPKIMQNEMIFMPYETGGVNVSDAPYAKAIAPKLLIIPGLAFSIQGYRLGFGMGYYDKYLAHFKPIAIGTCFHDKLLEKLPIDKYDHKLNYIVTDKLIIKI